MRQTWYNIDSLQGTRSLTTKRLRGDGGARGDIRRNLRFSRITATSRSTTTSQSKETAVKTIYAFTYLNASCSCRNGSLLHIVIPTPSFRKDYALVFFFCQNCLEAVKVKIPFKDIDKYAIGILTNSENTVYLH